MFPYCLLAHDGAMATVPLDVTTWCLHRGKVMGSGVRELGLNPGRVVPDEARILPTPLFLQWDLSTPAGRF